MKQTRIPEVLAASAGMLFLILDSKTAIRGAAEGIQYCVETVIPSLFPFITISCFLSSKLSGKQIPSLRYLFRITGIPAGSESILLTGMLGGYPVGAQTLANARRAGHLSEEDARRMMAFCNNAGPAFIFGIAASLFHDPLCGWLLWAIHIFSALLTAAVIPRSTHSSVRLPDSVPVTFQQAVSTSVRTMGGICGWVVIFKVLLCVLERWFIWMFPPLFRICLTGVLELTNGCCALAEIPHVGLRFVLCSAMLAFGGVCVGMQTATVGNGVDLRLYLPGKLMQTLFSIFLSFPALILLRLDFPALLPCLLPAAAALIAAIYWLKFEKRSSISRKAGV